MALKDTWKDKVDDQNYVMAEDINSIVQEVISIGDDVANKVDKEEGKGLSTNDYTDEEKQKLSEVFEGAERTANKITSYTGNETDEQYPSGKLFWDEIIRLDGKADGIKSDSDDRYMQLGTSIDAEIERAKATDTDHTRRIVGLEELTVALTVNKEEVSNKITEFTGSETDDQYPSAKCVMDYLGILDAQELERIQKIVDDYGDPLISHVTEHDAQIEAINKNIDALIQGKAEITYVDESIQSAILDSWEEAV